MATSYFAIDGNYGNADGIVIVETSDWSEDDWSAVEMAGDADRASVAYALAKSDEQQRAEIYQSVMEDDLDAQFDKAVEKE
ncbi:MAG: hypothetical protein EBT95_00305 [Verrucomicrobia bacterium]|nr:hypothetical protein [Verrucomicrobiota bacterium]